jgi:PAS domain S-box-containing protein
MSMLANDWDESERSANLRWVAEILDGFQDGFCAFDWEWRITHANQAAADYTGLDPAEVFGRTYWEVVPQALGTELEVMLRKAMAERLSIEIELASALKPGGHIAIRAFPIQGGLGMSFRDVTEHHQRRRSEQQQGARLQMALSASGMGDWVWNAATDEITFSERAGAIFGLAPDQPMTWRATHALIHPDDREFVIAEVNRAFSNLNQYAVEMRVHPADGRDEIWVMARGQVQADAQGQPSTMIGVVADITAERTRQAQLRETEARFRIMADGAPAPVWVTTAEGLIEFVNQAFADYAGATREELLGNGWAQLVHPDDRAEIVARREAASSGPAAYGWEAKFRRYDGEWRWLQARSSPRFDAEGVFRGYVGIATDVTEMRLAEARQQLLINELNHRVKNTLATVQSLAEQSSRLSRSKDEFKVKFLARLMALSAAHSRLTQSSWDWTALASVIEDQLKLHGAGDRLRASGPALLVPPGTALSLSMALHELATNAAKYGALSGDSGEAVFDWAVESRASGEYVKLSWRETGGPPVEVPTEKGFGSRLLQMVGRELGGEGRLDFAPTGLVWTASFPMPVRRPPQTVI